MELILDPSPHQEASAAWASALEPTAGDLIDGALVSLCAAFSSFLHHL
jgi:hypothetical protein